MTVTQSGPGDLGFEEAVRRLSDALEVTRGPIDRSDRERRPEPADAAVTGVQALVELCMYSQALPIITPALLDQIETALPMVIEEFGKLGDQPARKGQLQELTRSIIPNSLERSGVEIPFTTPGGRPVTLVELLQHDFGSPIPTRNPVAFVALAVSAMAFGYAVGHTWAK